PERLDGRHPELSRTPHVLVEPVADENSVFRCDVERLECSLEDCGVRLSLADLRRKDRKVEALREAHLLEVAMQEPAGVEGIRDEPELEAARTQSLEQRVGVRGQLSRRIPGFVLGLEEAGQFLVADLDSEVAEKLPHQAGVLELFDRARRPEEGLIALAKVSGDALDLRQLVPVERPEAGTVSGLDERLVVGELHQGIAPVEEDGRPHVVRVSAWRESSFGRLSRSLRSPSSSTGCSTRAMSFCSCSRRLPWCLSRG